MDTATRPDTADLVDAIRAIGDTGVRRRTARQAADQRRADLERYAQAYAEVYGQRMAPAAYAARLDADPLLLELETLVTA